MTSLSSPPLLSAGLASGTEARADPPPPGLPTARLIPHLRGTSAVPHPNTTLTDSPCAPSKKLILRFPEIVQRTRTSEVAILRRKCPTEDYISQQTVRCASADNLRPRRGGNSCPETCLVLDSTRSLAAGSVAGKRSPNSAFRSSAQFLVEQSETVVANRAHHGRELFQHRQQERTCQSDI